MDPTDESKRKPRRTRGTPSYYYRNRFAAGVIATGVLFFGIFTLTPIYRFSNEKITTRLLVDNEEVKARKEFFNYTVPKTSKFIEEAMKEKEKLFSER
ncbi:uncharacterized protein LOC119670185 [Teleopsis dalmanni]|uniref:uncharacterized protein LOC119670185 n=1 Tax=Teleopsis dalmanni TaxID=139649 RepID=UPI0018CC8246|nr:uncharacterized protein LOC119670185 [Teleopsis dalmanni]